MTYNLRIADLPLSERPREKLLNLGVKYLSNAELIAILLGTGQGKGGLSAVGLGQHILKELSQFEREPLDLLRDISPQELMTIQGVGPAKATTILAAIELGKRTYQFSPKEKVNIDSPTAAVAALSNQLMWQKQEHFAVVLLDTKNNLLGTQIITVGTSTETLVAPADVFRTVIKQGATKTIVAHNHPSGNVEPSESDLDLTKQLLQGSQLLSIPILDHLILGQGNYQSLRQITNLWQEFPQGD